MFFGLGEKVVFTNCVFEKLCFPENIICVVFSAKHSSCNKMSRLQTKIRKWVVFEHGKKVFFF